MRCVCGKKRSGRRLVGHDTCRACDAEASRDTHRRWGLDSQRGHCSRREPAGTAVADPATPGTEVPEFRFRPARALELPAVRMDDGRQAVDPVAPAVTATSHQMRSAAA